MPAEVERKLAAILSADVVGYSRLMADTMAASLRSIPSDSIVGFPAGSAGR